MNEAQYIEHEVQIRALMQTMRIEFDLSRKNSDDKFEAMEKNTKIEFELGRKNSDDKFELIMKNFDDKLDNRFKSLWAIGLLIMGLLTPGFIKSIGLWGQ